jgi:hypothetical protein
MIDFVADVRHHCRNPRCRSKLPAPVSNPREAFCTKGCHGSFYLQRCLVCEGPIKRKREDQKVCRRAKCRNAWRAGSGFGRYVASNAKLAAKDADSIGLKQPLKPGRPWRLVAGPELTPSAFHCATVGAEEAVEAINRTNARHWREANAKAEERCLIQRHDPPINVLGGYRFPGAPNIDLSPIATAPAPLPEAPVVIGDGLDIPQFLLRRPKAA